MTRMASRPAADSTPARQRARLVLAALLVGLALVSCTSTDDGATRSPAPRASRSPGEAPAGSAPVGTAPTTATYAPAPCPFPDQGEQVHIVCGELAVPEDRSRPERATIHLAVARIARRGGPADADPLLYLEGGPGGSALAEIGLWTAPLSPLLADRDVILVDQRGTGYSTPRLTCDPELDDPASDEWSDDELTRVCHDRLTGTGVDLGAYDTVESAHDIEDLRLALGISRWNVMGVSYGTRLALEVMRQHPGGLRSVVLDSVYPPGVKGLDEQPSNAWGAMKALLDDCRADDACNRAFPDLERRFLATVDRLDRQPVTIERSYETDDPERPEHEEVEMTGAELVRTLFDAMYVSAVLPDVPKAIDAAADGDLQRADDLLAGSDVPEGPASDLSAGGAAGSSTADEPPSDTDGLFLTIACAEDAPEATEESVRQASAGVPEPVRRSLVADVEDQRRSCRSWSVPSRHLDPVHSEVPTLLLAGSDDPITPPRWARTAAQTLAHSRVVEIHGAGHGVIDAGPCAEQTIVTFLATPTGPSSPVCEQRPRFSVP
jgi:pimeloyl-ACP methyl ester carboxylesterase